MSTKVTGKWHFTDFYETLHVPVLSVMYYKYNINSGLCDLLETIFSFFAVVWTISLRKMIKALTSSSYVLMS